MSTSAEVIPSGARRVSHAQASKILASRSPAVAGLVAACGPMKLEASGLSHFAALVRSIVHQQLAGSAASAIHARVHSALQSAVSPETVAATERDVLRSAGLSNAKVASICDLAAKVLDGTVNLEPRRVGRMPDEAVVAELCKVKGIGVWTAQMFLLFQLRRFDVWPVGDLGVRRGYGLAFGVEAPSPSELEDLGDQFRPYRSVAAWYCWRACEVLSPRRKP
ncbi:MAG: DNA-3-methyladenine glycosylase family protein [Acidimicrobiales bacterium]